MNNRPDNKGIYGTGAAGRAASGASEAQKENKMGTMPVGKLLFSMALPMMFSFFIQALYNIVDSIFVAQISENALTAVSLAFPMQNVMHAIAVGTGVGISATIPRCIGAGNHEKASRTANTGIFLNLCHSLIFILLGIFAVPAIYHMQTNVAEIVDGGIIYLRICWILCLGTFFGVYFEKMLTSIGSASLAMISQASGAIFNIVFDPLLIFGIGPFPRLGIAGAALATVLGQIFAACIALTLNLKKNRYVTIRISRILHPGSEEAKEIYRVGFPSMITIGLNSVSSFLVNQILLGYSTTATAVYGIWMKLQNFCFMPGFGMNNGMVPIVSFNHGIHRHDRVVKTIRYALFSILGLMLVLTCILELIPGTLLTLFNASDNMRAIGIPALRICILSLTFGSCCIILSSAMQALQKAHYTLIINILRNFVFLVGSFALFSAIFHDLNLVWIAIPVTEICAAGIAVGLYRKMKGELGKAM